VQPLTIGELWAPERPRSALEAELATRGQRVLEDAFAAQLAKRLRDHDPVTTPALGWLEARLDSEGTSIDAVVHHAPEREGASYQTSACATSSPACG